jgi:hypothetical protein
MDGCSGSKCQQKGRENREHRHSAEHPEF